jgi:hypothetical protein
VDSIGEGRNRNPFGRERLIWTTKPRHPKKTAESRASRGRWFDGYPVLGCNRYQLSGIRHAAMGSGFELGEHLINAAARRIEDEDASGLIPDTAESMIAPAGTEKESTRPGMKRLRLALAVQCRTSLWLT